MHKSKDGKHCDVTVRRAAMAKLPTQFGEFTIIVYSNNKDKKEHVALVKGNVKAGKNILVRIHSKCLTGDSFFSMKCDCGPQLKAAMKKIGKEGRGVIVYLDQEGRGIGLVNKIKAYALQDKGRDTVEANVELGLEADGRDYHAAAEIIQDLGILSIKLMTNNPKKIEGLARCGVGIGQRLKSVAGLNKHNRRYMRTKRTKFGHLISDSV
jgi:GTP cyclohydrolase II